MTTREDIYSNNLTNMKAHNVKTARNRELVRMHDKGISMRQIAEKMLLSVSVVHTIYWREKMRSGETRGIPKEVKKKFPQFKK